MTILAKAQELADAIAECDELHALRAAEKVMTADPEAMEILQEFQAKQREYYEVQMSGRELDENQKAEVARIEGRMSGNAFIRKFVEAEQNFEKLLNEVNMVIAKGISGGDQAGCGCGPEGSMECGPGCSCS